MVTPGYTAMRAASFAYFAGAMAAFNKLCTFNKAQVLRLCLPQYLSALPHTRLPRIDHK